MNDAKAPTHIAYAMKREGRRHGRWLEIGKARMDSDGVTHVFLDRTPIGGFNGYVYLAPVNAPPPMTENERSSLPSEDEEA